MINWGLAGNSGGFQSALAQGLQLGQAAGQAQRQRSLNNALADFDPTNPDTLKPVMKEDPRVGMQLRGQMQQQQAAQMEAQKEQQLADLTDRAVQGDETALTELASVNFERWKSLDGATRERATQQATLYGNAVLDVLQAPPGPERRERIVTYAQQFPQLAEQINEIAFLPPAEQEAQLRAVVVEANLTQRLHQMEQPSYQAIPEGGTLVNTRDPAAVQQFQGETQGGMPQSGGRVIAVQTPAQAAALPPGTRYTTPDGAEYIR